MTTLYILAGIGALFVGLVAFALGSYLINESQETRATKRWNAERKLIDEAYQARLSQDAWWFSEDPATMHLLQELADSRDVFGVRERWRAARKSEGEKKL